MYPIDSKFMLGMCKAKTQVKSVDVYAEGHRPIGKQKKIGFQT
jgi:hypothetical protein